ncbi:MAG: LysM peptidoglycan-binding domain-containing protein [Pseudomonadota bacterium]
MKNAVFHRKSGRSGPARGLLGCAALALLAACADADLDLRDLANGFDTSEAALSAVSERPEPDNRGVISYPGYQVAVARRGDTVTDVAQRVGLPAEELARFNGAPVNAVLNRGEVLALPRRVSEPSPATGSATTGPIQPTGEVDVAALAGDAIDRAEQPGVIRRDSTTAPRVQTGEEPQRHKVAAGETAFSISRRYGVPIAALAEWNGLDREYTLREGQVLLIPPAAPGATAAAAPATTTQPGEGSPTPTPPSAAEPLPEDAPPAAAATAAAAAESDALPESPNLAQDQTEASASTAQFVLPVDGAIVRDFGGDTEGLVISAQPGQPVRAAGAGTVRTITDDTIEGDDEARVVIVRHEGGLSTVYVNVRDLAVGEGDRVARGASIGEVGDADPSLFQFQVRQGSGMTVVDPNDYIN